MQVEETNVIELQPGLQIRSPRAQGRDAASREDSGLQRVVGWSLRAAVRRHVK